jgi:hypothetical protein
MRHRAACLALALALGAGILLTGCPAGDGSGGCAAAAESAWTPAAPVPVRADLRPVTVLRAAVDLSAGARGGRTVPVAAVERADGGVHVLLDRSPAAPALVSVSRASTGLAVTGTALLPRLAPTGDLHLLPDGRVLVPGRFPAGWGLAVVDPASGAVTGGAVLSAVWTPDGRSVLSRDGRTVHLLLTGFRVARLAAVDAGTGRVLAERDLTAELWPRTGPVHLLPRPHGGVTVVVDAGPQGCTAPTVRSYDDALDATSPPLALAAPGDRARTRAAATTPDGAVFVSADVPGGSWVLAVPAGHPRPSLVLTRAGRAPADALVVNPWQAWVLLPAGRGAEAVNLATGGVTGIDVGCRTAGNLRGVAGLAQDVLLLGNCRLPADVPMLWVTSP